MNEIKHLSIKLILAVLLLCFSGCTQKESLIPEELDSPVEAHAIDYSKISSINGRYHYEDEDYIGIFGIDVSTFQDDIDWQKVKEDGVEFAYIRIGRRGASDGRLYIDDLFETNYANATANGIKVGVYFFSQAYDTAEAAEEAEWVLRHIKDKKIDLPVVYDCEEVYLSGATPRIADLDAQAITDNTIAFCQRLNDAHYPAIIYTNLNWSDNFLEMDRLQDQTFWFAQYDVDQPDFTYPLAIWQYSDQGQIDGINTDVDLDIMFLKKEK